MANYPGSLPASSPSTHGEVKDEIIAIATEVGLSPSGWATTVASRMKIAEHMVATGGVLWVTGRYFFTMVSGTTGVVTPTASRLYLTPMYFPQSRSFDRLSLNVTTAGSATNVARVGLYNAHETTGLPTTVNVDGGTLVIDTTGIKEATVSSSVEGLFWFAFVTQSGSYTSCSTANVSPIGGSATATVGVTTSLTKDTVDPTTALPDLTGDGTLAYSTLAVPVTPMRAA